jgi:hypothetical protein
MSVIPSASSKEKWRCTCERYCHGDKPVSRRTYDRHAKYRHLQISASDESSSDDASSNESSDNSLQSNTSDNSAPPRKRARYSSNLPEDADFAQQELQDDDFVTINDVHELVSFVVFRSATETQRSEKDDADDADNPASDRRSPDDSDSYTIDPRSLDDDEECNTPRPKVSDDETDSGEAPDDAVGPETVIEDLQISLDFIAAVKNASLDNGDLDAETLHRLRNPSTKAIDVSDPAERYSLDLFLAATHGSEESYNANRAAYLRRHPENEVLTLARIKSKVVEWSGIVPILSHMCPNTCMAFTGPFADRQACTCGLPRFDVNGSAQEFYTIPLGLQLQALFGSPESAKKLHYRREKTAEILATMDEDGNLDIPVYEDLFHGKDYLDAVNRGDIKDHDVVVTLLVLSTAPSSTAISTRIVGSRFGSSQILHPNGGTKYGISFPTPSSPAPINQSTSTHSSSLLFTISRHSKRKDYKSGMHMTTRL